MRTRGELERNGGEEGSCTSAVLGTASQKTSICGSRVISLRRVRSRRVPYLELAVSGVESHRLGGEGGISGRLEELEAAGCSPFNVCATLELGAV